jgi:hypothetical protein
MSISLPPRRLFPNVNQLPLIAPGADAVGDGGEDTPNASAGSQNPVTLVALTLESADAFGTLVTLNFFSAQNPISGSTVTCPQNLSGLWDGTAVWNLILASAMRPGPGAIPENVLIAGTLFSLWTAATVPPTPPPNTFNTPQIIPLPIICTASLYPALDPAFFIIGSVPPFGAATDFPAKMVLGDLMNFYWHTLSSTVAGSITISAASTGPALPDIVSSFSTGTTMRGFETASDRSDFILQDYTEISITANPSNSNASSTLLAFATSYIVGDSGFLYAYLLISAGGLADDGSYAAGISTTIQTEDAAATLTLTLADGDPYVLPTQIEWDGSNVTEAFCSGNVAYTMTDF